MEQRGRRGEAECEEKHETRRTTPGETGKHRIIKDIKKK